MIRSDYCVRRDHVSNCPPLFASRLRSRSSGARVNWRSCGRCCRGAEGEGRRVVAARRRARLGQEPARARVRCARPSRGSARPVRGVRCRRPYPVWAVREALGQLVRAVDPAEFSGALGPAGGELTRLLPDLPARSAATAAGQGGSRYRASSPAHGGHRAARGRQPPATGSAGDRGRALGRRADATAAAPSRPLAVGRRAGARVRDVPRHRCRGAGNALARRWPTCGGPTTSCACGGRTLPTRRWANSSGSDGGEQRRRAARARPRDRAS